jgi:hypothetical protein
LKCRSKTVAARFLKASSSRCKIFTNRRKHLT